MALPFMELIAQWRPQTVTAQEGTCRSPWRGTSSPVLECWKFGGGSKLELEGWLGVSLAEASAAVAGTSVAKGQVKFIISAHVRPGPEVETSVSCLGEALLDQSCSAVPGTCWVGSFFAE